MKSPGQRQYSYEYVYEYQRTSEVLHSSDGMNIKAKAYKVDSKPVKTLCI